MSQKKHFSRQTAEIRGWTGCCAESLFRTTISCYRRMCSSLVGCLFMQDAVGSPAMACLMKTLYVQLYKHFLQLQDYNDRVKTAEQRLQVIIFSSFVSFITLEFRGPVLVSVCWEQLSSRLGLLVLARWGRCADSFCFDTSLLLMLPWSSLTWPKMLPPEMARCMRMVWFEHPKGPPAVMVCEVTNLLDL